MKNEVRGIILGLVEQRKSMQGLGEDDDYFDLGVSSLTIVELQVAVESALRVTIPTNQLMRLSKIREWIEVYAAAVGARAGQHATANAAGSLAGDPR